MAQRAGTSALHVGAKYLTGRYTPPHHTRTQSSAPGERRCDIRHPGASAGSERLWIICHDGAMGGQAVLQDISMEGIGILVDRRAWRLMAALRDAEDRQATVGVCRIPGEPQRQARVVWSAPDDESSGRRFGLRLVEPLSR